MSPKKPKEDLADFIRRTRREKGLSLDKVAKRSNGAVSKGYLSQIENRHTLNVSKDMLMGIAKGLEVDPALLFDVARGVRPEEDEDFLLTKYYAYYQRHQAANPDAKHLIDTYFRIIDKILDEDEQKAGQKVG